MKIDIVTLFPNYFNSPLQESLLAKAIKQKILEVNIVNLRKYSNLPHQSVDDKPYGGGPGMVLRADVLAACVKDLKKDATTVILLDPTGTSFNQNKALEISKEAHIILICGRYEGVDQRFQEKYVDSCISIGDYVLNGGEVASLVIVESVMRLLPGSLGNSSSLKNESFSTANNQTMLDYPHYTRPEVFENLAVPNVLLSGNHQEIDQWRKKKSLELTNKLRPDLLKK